MIQATLTERQRSIYDYLRSHISTHGYGPSVGDIGAEFDIKSPNGVRCHLLALQKHGLIEWEPGKNRTIQILGEKRDHPAVALLRELKARCT